MSVYLKNFRFPRIWQFIALLQIISIYYLCLRESVPAPPPFPHLDKIFHFTAYFFLSGYLHSILKVGLFWKQVLTLLLMGYSVELLQTFTETRSYDLLDMLANIAGVFLGIFIFKLVKFDHLLKNIELKLS